MPRVFVPDLPDAPTEVTIEGDEAHYLRSVLRLAQGDDVTIVGSAGQRFISTVRSVTKAGIILTVGDRMPTIVNAGREIVLIQGILKGQKMELVIQKASELGVMRLSPVVTERTQIRETRKPERWRKLALEAARQCGRPIPMEIDQPVDYAECLRGLPDTIDGFIFWEEAETPIAIAPLPAKDSPLYVVIGPEGGLTAHEVEAARLKGLSVSTLGNLTLRAETASIAAITIIRFLSGGFALDDRTDSVIESLRI